MDNLTHSLIGAVLGQAGLKRKTGLAMPALIIAANIPDIDAGCVVFGTQSLAMRRGITHGPIGLLLLPLLLTGLLVIFDRWQARRGTRPEGRAPVHPGWLLALCYIGTISHPLFDWFNNYGIRLLEPFSHRWFYGDTLFIIDIWILLILGTGIWRSLRRERTGGVNWARPARAAIAGVLAYVMLNLGISTSAANSATMDAPYAGMAVANPVPLVFWRREVLWRQGNSFGSFDWSLFGGKGAVTPGQPINMGDPRIAEWASRDPAAQAFLFWSRMPLADPESDRIILKDQRFDRSPATNMFVVTLKPGR